MLIKRITLTNFRQFKGVQTLEFATDPEQNVTVLLGDNTFGKTTILQAFQWCLYGKAEFPSEGDPDFLLNRELSEASFADKIPQEVKVELVLTHKDTEYTIIRTQQYVPSASTDKWNIMLSHLSVAYKENGITKQVRINQEKETIDNILPESLSRYFFFDTERVSDISSRKGLSDAVKGLLGLAAIQNMRKHLGDLTHKTTAIGMWNKALNVNNDDQIQDLDNSIDEKQAELDDCVHDNEEAAEQIEWLNDEIDRINNILRENQQTADLQKEKLQLEKQIQADQQKLDQANKSFLNYFSSRAAVFYLLPLMNKAEQNCSSGKLDYHGIRDLTEATIRDIIARGTCLCGAEIQVSQDGKTGNQIYKNLLDMIEHLPPANIIGMVKNFQEQIISERNNLNDFYPTMMEKYQAILTHKNNIAENRDRVVRIEEQIAGQQDMGRYVEDLKICTQSLQAQQERQEQNLKTIGALEHTIKDLVKQREGLRQLNEDNQQYIKYIAYGTKICDWIDKYYSQKEEEMKNCLEEEVNTIFKKMYHGQRTVQIDSSYNVVLLSRINGKEMPTSESEGLKRVKNFAFITGLVSIAKGKATMGQQGGIDSIEWENESYPLVMDAPFSNADETHIKNISAVLPEVANQVIMFVMEKDWQYAKSVMESKVGKYFRLKKHSEAFTEITE